MGERLLSMGVFLFELHDQRRILTDRLDNEEPGKGKTITCDRIQVKIISLVLCY